MNDALISCQIFLCLCSPSYYESEFCGKEWEFFRARLEEHALQQGIGILPLIFPVHWIPLPSDYRNLPEGIAKLQLWDHDLQKFQGLARVLQTNSRQYKVALANLVDALMQLKSQYRLSAGSMKNFKDIPSAFHLAAEPAVESSQDGRGVRDVQFAIIAGCRQEIETIRQAGDAYGDEPRDWSPYSSPIKKRIGAIAQAIAGEEDFTSAFLPLTPNLRESLDQARNKNNVVIFLVDPWSLRLQNYREKADVYDGTDGYNRALLIPWADDDETKGSRASLENVISVSFPTKSGRQDEAFRSCIESLDRLKADLREAIIRTSSRILEVTKNLRRAGGGLISKPTISGPFGG